MSSRRSLLRFLGNQSLPLIDSMEIIGPDLTRARLKNALDILGGVSKKLTKKLEKEYKVRRGSEG